jgi:hypothetical protein
MKDLSFVHFCGIEVKGSALLGRNAIQAFVHWFAWLKMGNTSLRHDDFGTGLWILARSARSHSHGEYPDAAQLHAVAPCHRRIISSKMVLTIFTASRTRRCGFIPAMCWISSVFSTAAPFTNQKVASGCSSRQEHSSDIFRFEAPHCRRVRVLKFQPMR